MKTDVEIARMIILHGGSLVGLTNAETTRAINSGIIGKGNETVAQDCELARAWLDANTPHTSNPEHYQRGDIEPIDVIEAWGLDFRLANAIKYIARAGRKPGESRDADLEKAANYIHRARFGRWPWEVDHG